jgi:outer membrane protein OmpA-like peptidoglycan-associated protein
VLEQHRTTQFILQVMAFLAITCSYASAQDRTAVPEDSLQKALKSAEEAKIASSLEGLRMTIRNVDITKFPLVKLIVEVYDDSNRVMERVDPATLTVVENGVEKPVVKIEKINITEHVPVDFVFAVDVTGTMQSYIDGVKNNIEKFVDALRNRGIEYRLGLILFSDIIEHVHQPTSDVREFLGWFSKVFASGGFDEKENALEAIKEATNVRWNPAANRVIVVITDAPYHQIGERGNGRTFLDTQGAVELLKHTKCRLFAIASPHLNEYQELANSTRGAVYDIRQPFSKILDQYSTQLTNLYALSYRTDSEIVEDSINVVIIDEKKRELVKQLIPIVEIGRKFIIENLLFKTNSSDLPASVEELDVLIEFMKGRPEVQIRVEGHTDNTGSVAFNKRLSQQRAESVRQYISQHGVDVRRITTVGFGPSQPIADNATEFGRRLNRRTEIVIVAK